MPLYEYLCRSCDRRFEAYLRAWGDSARCPSCQGDTVERLLSAFAVGGAGDRAPSASAGAGACCGGGCGCRS